jgi:hypothetical protein
MRWWVFAIAVISACGGTDRAASEAIACTSSTDCTLAGATCCACPSYAIASDDPSVTACGGVSCPFQECAGNVQPSCVAGSCEMTCLPMPCDASCPSGFLLDPDGCLTCACAAPDDCGSNGDCVDTRADCCGCALGGSDTAVVTGTPPLACPADPQCPGDDTCDTTAQALCVAKRCFLLTATDLALPAGTTLCGRGAGSSTCPDGSVCTINQLPQASVQGAGVCLPL